MNAWKASACLSIVAAGPRSALPHARPSTEQLGANRILLMDTGALRSGYCSDMTRVLYLGTPGRRSKQLYRAVLEAQLAAIDAIRAGVTAGAVDRAARRVLKAHGLERMFVRASDMVHDSLDAFVDLDVEAAREVCRRDDEVDEFNRQVIEDLLDTMRTRSDLVEAALHFFSVCRHVERIGDCATNIAEDVLYLVEGEIARHHFDNISY